MKLESLKSPKFEAFKSNVLTETINIVGGKQYCTSGTAGDDCWDDSTGKDIHCTDSTSYDICKQAAIFTQEMDQNQNQYVLAYNPNCDC